MSRGGSGFPRRAVIDEFANDLLLYTKWPQLNHFIYLIDNAQALRDPESLEKLAGSQTINNVTLM